MRVVVALGGNALLQRGQALSAENQRANMRVAAEQLAEVLVDPADPAFQNPTKPVGPIYDRAEAEKLQKEKAWSMVPDGQYFRRVVPSPLPQRIIEMNAIRLLVDNGIVVICAGGGGCTP